MRTKLTLRVDEGVIEKAKVLAKREGTSVSRLVEDYLEALAAPAQPLADEELTPALRALRALPKPVIDPNVVAEDQRLQYLLHKHVW